MGTIFHKTKVDLESWFVVIAQMLIMVKRISIRSITRMINIKDNAALRMTNKVHESMSKDILAQKLADIIECDEVYIGVLSKWHKNKPDENGEFKVNKRGVGTEHQVCICGQRSEGDRPKKAKVVVHISKDLCFTQLYLIIK